MDYLVCVKCLLCRASLSKLINDQIIMSWFLIEFHMLSHLTLVYSIKQIMSPQVMI